MLAPYLEQPFRPLHAAAAGQVKESPVARDTLAAAVGADEADLRRLQTEPLERDPRAVGLAQDRVEAMQVTAIAPAQPFRMRNQRIAPGHAEVAGVDVLDGEAKILTVRTAARERAQAHGQGHAPGTPGQTMVALWFPGDRDFVPQVAQRVFEKTDVVREPAAVVPGNQVDRRHDSMDLDGGGAQGKRTPDVDGKAEGQEEVERMGHGAI